MNRLTLITLDYPPERGGVARYLGELVRVSNGGIGTVVVGQNHDLTGPGQVIPREFFWHAWPKWGPMIRVCREVGTSGTTLLTSHLLPVGTAAMIAQWIGGAPYAVICHGLDIRLAAFKPWKRLLARMVLRGARLVVANSETTAGMIREIVPDLQPLVLTPGVTEPSVISREDARRELGIEPEEEIILSVARLVPRKGMDLLLEATEQLKDRERVRTVIVGDGPELPNLRQLAEHLKHPVTFVTDATDDDLAKWYAAADVFCLPVRSFTTDVEGFGIVYVEASSYGLPVVATRSGGVTEAVVDGKTGLLVPENDVSAITDALRRLLDDSALRETLGAAGRQRARTEFSWIDRWKRIASAL